MNLNPGTWQSIIRSVGLVIGGILVYAGLISQTSVADIVQKAVDAAPAVTQAISFLLPLGLSIWGAMTHTDKSVVHTASLVPGVETIKVDRAVADPPVAALANDANVPTVQPAEPPHPFVSSTIQQRR